MRTRLPYLLIPLLFILMHSCRTQDKSGTDIPVEVTFYNISLEKALDDAVGGKYQSATLSEIGGNISYIPLELSANSAFRTIRNITIYDSSIYISDMYRMLKFTQSGKFVRQISRQGKGPGEYVYIYGICANDTARYLFCGRICLKYTPKDEFVTSFNISTFEAEQMILMKDKIVFSSVNVPARTSPNPYSLYITDLNFNLNKTFRNYHKKKAAGHQIMDNPLYSFREQVRYKSWVADTLFTVTVDSLIPYARFDLGNQKLPNESLDQDQDKVLIMRILEDTRFFYMKFSYFGKPGRSGIYSKQTGEIKILDESGFQNDIDGGLPFFPRYVYNDSILVDWVDAYDLREKVLNADAAEMRKLYGHKFDDLLKLAKSLNDDSGSVLVMVKP